MQGLALLVTFGAIAKSDWPRAAMERARRKRISCSSRPFAALRANGGGTHPLHAIALTLALSRAAGEGTDLLLSQRDEPAFKPLHAVIQPR